MEVQHEVWPLDVAIMKTLPKEGEMLGGVHYLGRRIKDVSAELGEYVTSPQVNSRMRICKANEFVVDHPASGGRVWQITQRGLDYLHEIGERNNHEGPEAAPAAPAEGSDTHDA